MQPTYLPWIGYFDLIDRSDVFVFLDNVQFEKQSWQQRNRIRTPKGLEWLTVPVRRRFPQLIKDVEILPGKFPSDHLRAIEQNYRRVCYFEKYYSPLSKIILDAPIYLCELNIRLIQWLASAIGIDLYFEKSSTLKAQGKRVSLLVDICKRVGADVYLSPMGSLEYLTAEYSEFTKNNIRVVLHNYNHPQYAQLYRPFIPFASGIDLVFNEGESAIDIMRSGGKEPIAMENYLK